MRLQAKLAVIAGRTARDALPAVALGAAGGHPNYPTTRTTGASPSPRANELLRQRAGSQPADCASPPRSR
jgi:hypothetical protein